MSHFLSAHLNLLDVPDLRLLFDNIFQVDGGVVCFAIKKESEYPLVASQKVFFSMVRIPIPDQCCGLFYAPKFTP